MQCSSVIGKTIALFEGPQVSPVCPSCK